VSSSSSELLHAGWLSAQGHVLGAALGGGGGCGPHSAAMPRADRGQARAVLSLDAADMSGVHNTDFASNGEVHKVRPRSQATRVMQSVDACGVRMPCCRVRSALPRLSRGGVDPGCRSGFGRAGACVGHTPEVPGAGLAWPYHTRRDQRRPKPGKTLTLLAARCGWTRRGGASAWASTSRRGGGASRCGGRARWGPHRFRVSAPWRTGPRGADAHTCFGRHVPRPPRLARSDIALCLPPPCACRQRTGSVHVAGVGALLAHAKTPHVQPRRHVMAHLYSYHPSRLHLRRQL